jgi:hypothetical protein
MKRTALAVLCLTAIMVSGCGSETTSEPEPPGSPLHAEQTSHGLQTYRLAAAGFSIGIPVRWTAMTAEDAYGAAVDQAIDENPQLAQYKDALTAPDSPFKLVAVKPEPNAGINSTINVLSFSLRKGWDADEFEQGAVRGAREQAAPGTTPTVDQFELPAGRALRIRIRTETPGTAITLISTQYLIQTRKTAYLIGYTTTARLADAYAKLFDRSARSLRQL